MAVFVNLGCGKKCLDGWVNIDFVAQHPSVQVHDLRNGIPLDSNTADVLYHSHVLEHFSKEEGAHFLQECFRVLKPGGILRVVVPDLQQLALNYLQALEAARQQPGDAMASANYEWAVVELIDQMVRQTPGGEMLRFWQRTDIVNQQQVAARMGAEFRAWRAAYQSSKISDPVAAVKKKSWLSLFRQPKAPARVNMQETGELHKWMYDTYSLSVLLSGLGFTNIQEQTAFVSGIPHWEQHRLLDVEDGQVRKPDSLFMEAVKP